MKEGHSSMFLLSIQTKDKYRKKAIRKSFLDIFLTMSVLGDLMVQTYGECQKDMRVCSGQRWAKMGSGEAVEMFSLGTGLVGKRDPRWRNGCWQRSGKPAGLSLVCRRKGEQGLQHQKGAPREDEVYFVIICSIYCDLVFESIYNFSFHSRGMNSLFTV